MLTQETGDLTFQREKFEDYFVRLRWSKQALREFVDKRIDFLFRRKYTTDNVAFADVFTANVGSVAPFDYMIDRTLMRPRDILMFVNACIKRADGHYEVGASFIRKAEVDYSRARLEALTTEWQSAFPTLNVSLR